MADNTPRLNLNRYSVGDSNWDHSDLVNFVDEHAIARGPVADRPDVGEYPDALYYATDEGVLYRWDDAAGSWEAAIEAPPVDSVFGRVGQVVAEAGDYTASQITNFASGVIDAIDGSAITPSSVTTPEVSTEDLNNIKWVRSGQNIQTVLDNLDTETGRVGQPEYYHVFCEPAASFTRSTSVVIPPYTHLHLNGASLSVDSDVDNIVLGGPGAFFHGPGRIQLGMSASSFTSAGVKVDTSRSEFANTLNISNDNIVGVLNWPEIVAGSGGSGVAVDLDASGQSIGRGNLFQFHAGGWAQHLRLLTNNGNYINPSNIHLVSDQIGGGPNIIHENTAGAAAAARPVIMGEIQCDNSTAYALRNDTSQDSFKFIGQIFDPGDPGTAAISGPNLTVESTEIGNGSVVDFGVGTTVNGKSEQALAGSAPDATNWTMGDIIEDTDNAGDAYLILGNDASGNVTQIGT